MRHSDYAPKWARHSENEHGPDFGGGEDGQALSGQLLRRLQAEIVEYPDLPARAGRRLSIVSLVIASVVGATIVVAVIDAPRWTGALGVGTNAAGPTDRELFSPRPNVQHPTLQPPLAGGATATSRTTAPKPVPAPIKAVTGRAITATHIAALSPPPVQGVTDREIRLGIAAPFSGPAKELGSQMQVGIETAFAEANDSGGINGRQAKLVAADDGYEPKRTAAAMARLYDTDKVLGFIGNVGTPTAEVSLPYALAHHALYFGALTGAELLRRDPPDRYVFNYRASYGDETSAVVRYLLKVRHLRPRQIAVFAQHDAFGDAGFDGVAKAIRALHGDDEAILRLGYDRNTVDIDNAVAGLRAHKRVIKAVVMVAAYRPAARFIERTRDLVPGMIYTNVSFVDSTALANELMLRGPHFAKGMIVTQVVPPIDSYASAVLKYKQALAKYHGEQAPDFVSFEGYIDGSLLLEGLRRAGPHPDTEKLVNGLESIRNFDMGLGTPISFGPSEHQGSHKVWGTELNAQGHYEPIDLR